MVMEHNCILIIDDDVWIQKILSKILEGFGFTVLPASNGYEGISLAVEHQPFCIILDILMPELNGHQTLKILKNIKNTQQIPVLMLSAISDSENLGLAVKSGVAGFISKPFNKNSVYKKLAEVFGQETLEAFDLNKE